MSRKLQGSGVNYCIKALTVTMLCLAATLAMAPSLPADVVARYAFTTDASESIGGIYPGTLMNGAAISGGSVVLDGINQYVDLGAGPAAVTPNLTGSCSFETWVTWSGTGSLNQSIFDFGQGIGPDANGNPSILNHMYLSPNYGTSGSGNVEYALTPVSNTNGALDTPTPLPSTPTYIAITYNSYRAANDLAQSPCISTAPQFRNLSHQGPLFSSPAAWPCQDFTIT